MQQLVFDIFTCVIFAKKERENFNLEKIYVWGFNSNIQYLF